MVTIVVAVLSMLIASVNTRIDDLRDDVRSMDDRLRAVEVGFGRVSNALTPLSALSYLAYNLPTSSGARSGSSFGDGCGP